MEAGFLKAEALQALESVFQVTLPSRINVIGISIVELMSPDGSGLNGEVAKGHGKLSMCHIYVVGIVGLLPRLSFGRFCMMA